MNAVSNVELGRVTATQIQTYLNYREARLLQLRTTLAAITRESGRLTAKELQDFVCNLAACAGDDLRAAKASLLDTSVDLDGIIHYGSSA